jgi:protein-S-isoprenylcysteine O-methyltransferase Ste14
MVVEQAMLAMAWGGAALFAASLAYFAYFYLVQLSAVPDVPAGRVPGAVLFNLGLFTLFAVHHSVLARSRVKAWLARRLPRLAERVLYVWLASLLFLGVCLLWQPVPGLAWRASGPARWLLHGLQLAGAALTLLSAARIDIRDLAGIRQARTADAATRGVDSPAAASTPASAPPAAPSPLSAPSSATLQVGGPYRWVRHPIYLGWLLLVWPVATMTMGRLLFAALSTAYLLIAIPLEERSLEAGFGAAYRTYRQRVRWRLVPGLW